MAVEGIAVGRKRRLRRRRKARKRAIEAHVALQRFGLGPKPGLLGRVARNPEKALLAELNEKGVALIRDPSLPSYVQAARESQYGFDRAHAVFRREVDARIDKQMSAGIGFVERLVMFWSNHFSMSVNKSEAVRGTVGQLERDVIRRHVLGNFTDMLLGVVTHPAMISFLDNAESVGPNSDVTRWWNKGHNQNLAREVMELYTVGSGGGYDEDDVDQLARMLTGWSFVRGWEVSGNWNGGTEEKRGQFFYRPEWHEPGPLKLMGRTYSDEGQKQAVKALRRLAASPRTAEAIAFKLVRHFITDDPQPRQVRRLAKVFLKTRGNLKAVARALVKLPGALGGPLTKIRTPYENVVSQFRAIGRRYDEDTYWCFWCTLDALKQLPFECASPEGWPDETPAWLAPDAMAIRMDTALLATWIYAKDRGIVATKLADTLFGKALTARSKATVAREGDQYRALATLFMIPEFQRR